MADLDRWVHRTVEGEGSHDGQVSSQGSGQGSGTSARNLAGLAVNTLIEIGPVSKIAAGITEAWPKKPADEAAAAPVLFGSLAHAADEIDEEEIDGFLQAVKTAYDIGLPISAGGLFAGESRRRRALPGYPFQRMSYWIR